MKKILFVSTLSNTVNAFLIPQIELLINKGYNVDIACNVDREINPHLLKLGCRVHDIKFQRNPLKWVNYLGYKQLKKLIEVEGYDVVHTHTPIASALTRLACRNNSNIKVMYTAHGFHFFKGAPLKNWLIFFLIEKYLARYTDVLITINTEDYKTAKKLLKVDNIEYIPGVGVDIKKFKSKHIDFSEKRKEINVPEDAFLILSVGELNKNKNHEVIIKAIAKLDNSNIYYCICGRGPLEDYLKNLSKDLGIDQQVKLLGYRTDVEEICKVADVFAFPSKREGLGLAALEAMAAGLPIVTSNVHGILDYSIDGVTGFNCNPTNISCFSNAFDKLFRDRELRKNIKVSNEIRVEKYSVENSIRTMETIYKKYL